MADISTLFFTHFAIKNKKQISFFAILQSSCIARKTLTTRKQNIILSQVLPCIMYEFIVFIFFLMLFFSDRKNISLLL